MQNPRSEYIFNPHTNNFTFVNNTSLSQSDAVKEEHAIFSQAINDDVIYYIHSNNSNINGINNSQSIMGININTKIKHLYSNPQRTITSLCIDDLNNILYSVGDSEIETCIPNATLPANCTSTPQNVLLNHEQQACQVDNGYIYAFGGINSMQNKHLNEIWKCNPAQAQSCELINTTLGSERADIRTVKIECMDNDYIVLIGGSLDSGDVSSVVELFNVKSEELMVVDGMANPRKDFVAIFDDQQQEIFVFGGVINSAGNSYTQSIEVASVNKADLCYTTVYPTNNPTNQPSASAPSIYPTVSPIYRNCELIGLFMSIMWNTTSYNYSLYNLFQQNETKFNNLIVSNLYTEFDQAEDNYIDLNMGELNVSIHESIMNISYNISNCNEGINNLLQYLNGNVFRENLTDAINEEYYSRTVATSAQQHSFLYDSSLSKGSAKILLVHATRYHSFWVKPIDVKQMLNVHNPFTQTLGLFVLLVLVIIVALIHSQFPVFFNRICKCRISDNFRIFRVTSFVFCVMMFMNTLNTMYGFFWCYTYYNYDVGFAIFAAFLLVLISIKMTVNLMYLCRGFQNDLEKRMVDETAKQWTSKNVKMLATFIIFSNSFYGALAFANSNLFGLEKFVCLQIAICYLFSSKNWWI